MDAASPVIAVVLIKFRRLIIGFIAFYQAQPQKR